MILSVLYFQARPNKYFVATFFSLFYILSFIKLLLILLVGLRFSMITWKTSLIRLLNWDFIFLPRFAKFFFAIRHNFHLLVRVIVVSLKLWVRYLDEASLITKTPGEVGPFEWEVGILSEDLAFSNESNLVIFIVILNLKELNLAFLNLIKASGLLSSPINDIVNCKGNWKKSFLKHEHVNFRDWVKSLILEHLNLIGNIIIFNFSQYLFVAQPSNLHDCSFLVRQHSGSPQQIILDWNFAERLSLSENGYFLQVDVRLLLVNCTWPFHYEIKVVRLVSWFDNNLRFLVFASLKWL